MLLLAVQSQDDVNLTPTALCKSGTCPWILSCLCAPDWERSLELKNVWLCTVIDWCMSQTTSQWTIFSKLYTADQVHVTRYLSAPLLFETGYRLKRHDTKQYEIRKGQLTAPPHIWHPPLITMFMGPTWGPSGADRTQTGPSWPH